MTAPTRGEVWWVHFDPSTGAEIQKTRTAVVMSVPGLGRLPLRIVVPITEWQARYASYPWMVNLPVSTRNGLSKESADDAFQVKSVSEGRFGSRIGSLTDAQLEEIAAAIALCVGAP